MNTVPERARILIVDDDKELTFVLRAHLSSAGYCVSEAHTAERALELLGPFQPDIIVMDHGLPGMDGIEATRRIKGDEATSDVAVIMVTGRSDTDHIVLALEAGAQEYVVKPFEVAELLARIRTVHRLQQTRRELDRLNGKLTDQVEERTERLRILYNFTRSLNEAESREQVLDLTIQAVREVSGSHRVSILLKKEDAGALVCARATGIDPKVVPDIRLSLTEGIAGKVFMTGKTYVASTFEAGRETNSRYESDSFVSTPLIATSLMTSDETLGVLSITDKKGGGGFSPDEVECIRSIADSAAIALHNRIHRRRLAESVNVLLMTVGRLAEYRDNETGQHLERVRDYARLLTGEISASSEYQHLVDEEFVENIYRAAPMHDIGKVGIADEILCKPGKLTPAEFSVMKEHSRIGREVLESALKKTGPLPILKMCTEIAGSHHEKFDGAGYPEGLAGDSIPLSARIIALVDAYDAITSKRRYKGACAHDEAVKIIGDESGRHFDPEIVRVFLRCAHRFDEIHGQHADEKAEPRRTVACNV